MRSAVKVPEERVAVVVGTRRRTLKEIASATNTKMAKEENAIIIEGEAIDVWTAQSIVKAVARGFSPPKAMLLLEPERSLDIIDLSDYCRDSQMERIKGRIIGEGGKARRVMEQNTGCHISVYGKTVGIIGHHSWVAMARKAVLMLIEGANHSSVYKLLERERHRKGS